MIFKTQAVAAVTDDLDPRSGAPGAAAATARIIQIPAYIDHEKQVATASVALAVRVLTAGATITADGVATLTLYVKDQSSAVWRRVGATPSLSNDQVYAIPLPATGQPASVFVAATAISGTSGTNIEIDVAAAGPISPEAAVTGVTGGVATQVTLAALNAKVPALSRTATGNITTAAGASTAYVELVCPGAGSALFYLSGTFAGYTIVVDGLLNGVAQTLWFTPVQTDEFLTSRALTDSTAIAFRVPGAGAYDSIRVRATARTSGTLAAYVAATDSLSLAPRVTEDHQTFTDTPPTSASTAQSTTTAGRIVSGVLTGMSAYDMLSIASTGAGNTGGTLDTVVLDSFDKGVTWREFARIQRAAAAASSTICTSPVMDSTHTTVGRNTTAASLVPAMTINTTRPGIWGDYMTVIYVSGASTSAATSHTTSITGRSARR